MALVGKRRVAQLATNFLFKRQISVSQALFQGSAFEQTNEPIFGPEHRQLQESLRKLIDKDINPHVEEWEEAGIFPAHKVFKLLGENGFLGVNKPPEYGGMGLDYSYACALALELGNIHSGAVGMGIGVQTDMSTPALAKYGSEYLKQEFLAPSIRGDVVSCIGVSKPGAGSDVAAITTTAKRDGDDLIINGGKLWITNGTQADWMCLLANTNNGKSHLNKSLICLPMKEPGVTVARNIKKMGLNTSDTAQIFFEDVRVPAKNIIGEEGMGFTYQMLQFQEERLFVTATALTPLERVVEETIAYTQERMVFGQPVLNNQVVHYALAELATEIELLRSFLYRAIALYVNGQDVTRLASMLKLKVGRLSREVSDKCLQFWGGMGYTDESIVSRSYRDGRLTSIAGGTDEVMLAIICKYMGILPKPPKA